MFSWLEVMIRVKVRVSIRITVMPPKLLQVSLNTHPYHSAGARSLKH